MSEFRTRRAVAEARTSRSHSFCSSKESQGYCRVLKKRSKKRGNDDQRRELDILRAIHADEIRVLRDDSELISFEVRVAHSTQSVKNPGRIIVHFTLPAEYPQSKAPECHAKWSNNGKHKDGDIPQELNHELMERVKCLFMPGLPVILNVMSFIEQEWSLKVFAKMMHDDCHHESSAQSTSVNNNLSSDLINKSTMEKSAEMDSIPAHDSSAVMDGNDDNDDDGTEEEENEDHLGRETDVPCELSVPLKMDPAGIGDASDHDHHHHSSAVTVITDDCSVSSLPSLPSLLSSTSDGSSTQASHPRRRKRRKGQCCSDESTRLLSSSSVLNGIVGSEMIMTVIPGCQDSRIFGTRINDPTDVFFVMANLMTVPQMSKHDKSSKLMSHAFRIAPKCDDQFQCVNEYAIDDDYYSNEMLCVLRKIQAVDILVILSVNDDPNTLSAASIEEAVSDVYHSISSHI